MYEASQVAIRQQCRRGDELYSKALKDAGHAKALAGSPYAKRILDEAMRTLVCATQRATREANQITEERKRLERLNDQLGHLLQKRVWIKDIAKAVATRHEVTVSDLKSRRTDKHVVRARQEAFWLAKNLTSASSTIIGNFFNRDHTTVLHGIKRHAQRMEAGE